MNYVHPVYGLYNETYIVLYLPVVKLEINALLKWRSVTVLCSLSTFFNVYLGGILFEWKRLAFRDEMIGNGLFPREYLLKCVCAIRHLLPWQKMSANIVYTILNETSKKI